MNSSLQKYEMFSSDHQIGKMIKKVLETSKTDILSVIKSSMLTDKGLVPDCIYDKWQNYLLNESSDSYLVCNANESGPVAFKDQKILKDYTLQLLEGIVITCIVLNINHCIIVLRREYKWLLDELENAIEKHKENNLIGQNILSKGVDLDIKILFNYGSYVCGDQNAIIKSIHGYRAEPKSIDAPHEESNHIVHNVETLATIPYIIEYGAEKYRNLDKKLYSISGDCAYPGVYELNSKEKLKDVFKLIAALPVKAIHLGGFQGKLIEEVTEDIDLDFGSELGSSIIIYGRSRNLLDVIENIAKFHYHESCGQCTPCREGFFRLVEFFNKYKNKNEAISKEYIMTVSDIISAIQLSSRCPFGRKGVNSIKYYFDKYILDAQ